MYRAHGPAEMRPVGETEFVTGIAAMSDSGLYGSTRVARGHRGRRGSHARRSRRAGARSAPARGQRAIRGVRHSAAWDADRVIGNSRTATGPDLYRECRVPRGLASDSPRSGCRSTRGSSIRSSPGHDRARARDSRREHHRLPLRRAAGLRAVRGQEGRGLRRRGRRKIARAREVPERVDEARRHDDAAGRVRLRRASRAAVVARAGGLLAAVHRDVHRSLRRRTAACSRATSRWRRWASATPRCGTRSSASRRGRPWTRSWPCTAARPAASIAWPEPFTNRPLRCHRGHEELYRGRGAGTGGHLGVHGIRDGHGARARAGHDRGAAGAGHRPDLARPWRSRRSRATRSSRSVRTGRCGRGLQLLDALDQAFAAFRTRRDELQADEQLRVQRLPDAWASSI